LIVAIALFLALRTINRLTTPKHRDCPAAAAPPSEDVVMLRGIRDSLKTRS
jgi:large conductance mechanosensitive channel